MIVPFAIPPGMARGATSRALPGRWYGGNLVRWHGDVLAPIGGWLRTTVDPLASPPRSMVTWGDAIDNRYLGVGSDAAVYVRQGDIYKDITPTGYVGADVNSVFGGYGNDTYGDQEYGDVRENPIPAGFFRANTISLDNFGSTLLLTSASDGKLYKWAPGDTKATVVSGAPTSIRSMVVTPQQAVMVIGGNGTPRYVQWSKQETFDDWAINITTTAGFLPIETAGYLVTMRNVREGTLVWGDNDLFLVRFVGDPAIYVQEKIAEGDSLYSPNAIATYNDKAMWLTRRGFQMYEGGYVKDVPCELAEHILSNIDEFWGRTRTTAFFHGTRPEIWFLYPSKGKSENDCYVIYNFEKGQWYDGKLNRSCGLAPVPGDIYPIMASPDGHVWMHEFGDAFTSAGAGDIYVESGAIHPTPGKTFSASRVFPDSENGAECTEFTFFTRMVPEGEEYTKGPYVARPDGKMDVRFTCRQARVRIRQRLPGAWTVGEPEFDLRPRGAR